MEHPLLVSYRGTREPSVEIRNLILPDRPRITEWTTTRLEPLSSFPRTPSLDNFRYVNTSAFTRTYAGNGPLDWVESPLPEQEARGTQSRRYS